jgi:hypothetical protein
MSRFTPLRMLLVVSVVAVLALAGTTNAFATSSTNTVADLTVSASLLSNGSNPDVATAGNWVNVSGSITNNGPNQWVRGFVSTSWPLAFPALDYSRLFYMVSGRTIGFNFWVPVFRFTPSGVYTLHVGGLDTASFNEVGADASITIQNG